MKKEVLTYKDYLMKEVKGLHLTDWDIYDSMIEDKIDWRKRTQIWDADDPQKTEVSIRVQKKTSESTKKEESNYQLLILG
jgi:hypothetical protein